MSMHRGTSVPSLPLFALLALLPVGCASWLSRVDSATPIPGGGIKVEDGAGETLFELEPDGSDIDLESPAGRVGTYRVVGDRIEFHGVDGAEYEFARSDGSAWTVEVRSGEQTRIKIGQEPDGDFRVDDAGGQERWKIKKRDYGYKVVSSVTTREWKVRVKSDKASVRDDTDTTILSTDDTTSGPFMACLSLASDPATASLPLRAGLALATAVWPIR
ncbi:MAG: hypothetical protein KDC38_04730 [Planctomycetes bacterium]|nr:hypothetical protein [Planctomycetota bacterium]